MMKNFLMVVAIMILPLMIFSRGSADIILLDSGGQLNGQVVDQTHYSIQVEPGELLSGWINIKAYNHHSPAAVVPVAGTFTWGLREEQPWLVTGHITPGWHDLTVDISGQNKYAPTTPGIYDIIIANVGEFTADQIMSATGWAYERDYGHVVWYDDNDHGWDWTAAQFQQAREDGQVTYLLLRFTAEYLEATYGANWVEVHVVPEPGTILLASIGVGFVGWLRRRTTL